MAKSSIGYNFLSIVIGIISLGMSDWLILSFLASGKVTSRNLSHQIFRQNRLTCYICIALHISKLHASQILRFDFHLTRWFPAYKFRPKPNVFLKKSELTPKNGNSHPNKQSETPNVTCAFMNLSLNYENVIWNVTSFLSHYSIQITNSTIHTYLN